MSVFTEQDLGKKIPARISRYIIANQKRGDIKTVADRNGFSTNYLNETVKMNCNLTKENVTMIDDLFKVCLRNVYKSIETKEEVEDLIQNIGQ